MLKKLKWLPVKHHSVFKTATLVYKSLHIGIFLHATLLTAVPTVPGAVRVVILYLSLETHQFDYSFAFDAQTVWNALPGDSCIPLLSLLQKVPQNLPVHQGISTLVFLTPGAWAIFCSWILKLVDCFCFCCTLEST